MNDADGFRQRVQAFAHRWYARPLFPEDGNSEVELQRAEAAIGQPLPPLLAEWYRLLGRRLRAGQDRPVMLEDLVGRPDESTSPLLFPVWTENQGVFRISAGRDGGVVIEPSFAEWPGGSLDEVLLGLLVSETLIGAGAASGQGILGELGASVVGGWCQETSRECDERVRGELASLPWVINPLFSEPCLGDERLVMRANGDGWDWMASDEAGFEQANRLLGLETAGEPQELVIAYEDLSAEEFHMLGAGDPTRTAARLRSVLTGSDHLTTTYFRHDRTRARFHISTARPELTFARVRQVLPQGLDGKLVAAVCWPAIARFRVLHPAGQPHFHLR
jgi:hypothetical protein